MTAPSRTGLYQPSAITLQGDAADQAATAIAHSFLNGETAEADARWQIAAIVERLNELPRVAQGHVFEGHGKQAVYDLVERLRELLVSKVTGTPEVAASLDLTRLAEGASLRSWAWAFARTAAASEMRGMLRARKYCIPTDAISAEQPHGEDLAGNGSRMTHVDEAVHAVRARQHVEADLATTVADSLSGGPDREALEDITDEYLRRSQGARPLGRVHEQGRAVRRGFGVAPADRQAAQRRREQLRSIIEEDPTAARRSVVAAANGTAASPTDKMLGRLWSGHSRTELMRLATMDPLVSHALVLEATTPKPPPQQRVVEKVRARVREAIGAGGAGAQIVNSVVDAYVAHVSEVDCSEFRGTPSPKDPATLRADKRAFEAAASMLAQAGFQTLGASPREVAESLDTMFDRVQEEMYACA